MTYKPSDPGSTTRVGSGVAQGYLCVDVPLISEQSEFLVPPLLASLVGDRTEASKPVQR